MAKNKSRRNKPATPATRQNPKNTSTRTDSVAIHQEYSGPIPPASELAKYNNIVPNAAERILVMAEKNQQHSMDIDHKVIYAKRAEVRLGQVFAFLITIFAFGASIAAVVMGQPTVASVIGGATVVSLAVAFIKGRSSK